MRYIFDSKKGTNREKNQDRTLILDESTFALFVVFDGVSSNKESYTYIEAFIKEIKANYSNFLNEHSSDLGELFYRISFQLKSKELKGESTLSVLYISKVLNTAKYINIGDSRLYKFSNYYLEKVTIDDSLKNQNILTKYLGLEYLEISDFKPIEVPMNNNFLLCTDGFYTLMHKHLKDYFISLNFKKMANIKKKLASLQENNNRDDSTYILIKYEI